MPRRAASARTDRWPRKLAPSASILRRRSGRAPLSSDQRRKSRAEGVQPCRRGRHLWPHTRGTCLARNTASAWAVGGALADHGAQDHHSRLGRRSRWCHSPQRTEATAYPRPESSEAELSRPGVRSGPATNEAQQQHGSIRAREGRVNQAARARRVDAAGAGRTHRLWYSTVNQLGLQYPGSITGIMTES